MTTKNNKKKKKTNNQGIRCNPYMGYSPDIVIWLSRKVWMQRGFEVKHGAVPYAGWYGDERYCHEQVNQIDSKIKPVELGGFKYDSEVFAKLAVRNAMKEFNFNNNIQLEHDFINVFKDLFNKKYGDNIDNPIIKIYCVKILDPVRKGLKAVYQNNMAHTIDYDKVIDIFCDGDCETISKYDCSLLEDDEPDTTPIVKKSNTPPIKQAKKVKKSNAPIPIPNTNTKTPPNKSRCFIKYSEKIRYRFSIKLFEYLGKPKKMNIYISPCENYMELRTPKIGLNGHSCEIFFSGGCGNFSSHKIFDKIGNMEDDRLYICDYNDHMVKFDISGCVQALAPQLELELQEKPPAPKKKTKTKRKKVTKEPTWRDIGQSIKSKLRSIFK